MGICSLGYTDSVSAKTKSLTFSEAAVCVLEKAVFPMRLEDVLRQILRSGLVQTRGKTPKDTLYVSIRRTNDRCEAEGKERVFIIHGYGPDVTYSLACPSKRMNVGERAGRSITPPLRGRVRD